MVNLDDPLTLQVASTDPVAFLDSLPKNVAIDEFQRGGNNLLLALKMVLDARTARGQFVLAGSTRFLSTRTLAETLTGRIGIVELLPLSAGELRGAPESFLERAFDNALLGNRAPLAARSDYAHAVATGGFPELALGLSSNRFRAAWCDFYRRTITAVANIEQVAEIRRPDLLPGPVNQLAVRTATELVTTDLARELGAGQELVRAYLEVLATLYLVRLLPAWTTSRTNRTKRHQVAHLIDSAGGPSAWRDGRQPS